MIGSARLWKGRWRLRGRLQCRLIILETRGSFRVDCNVYMRTQSAMEVLSIRLDSGMKSRLDALARSSKRSRSVLAAQAIAEYLEAQEWQLGAIGEGIADADAGRTVNPEKVAFWLRSWGKPRERKAPL